MKLARFILFFFTWIYASILTLSVIHGLSPLGARVCALLFVLSLGCWLRVNRPVVRFRLSGLGAIVLLIFALTFIQGFFSAPNTTDAMVYHLPRVMEWIQGGSVFQTHLYTTHDYMPPFAEYLVTFFYLLVGSDRFAFLPQWLSMVGIVGAVIAYTKRQGIGQRGVWVITLLTLTTPILLLEATSTQTDLVMAFLVLFSLVIVSESLFLSVLSLTFAVITKQAAALFALPTAIAIWQQLRWNRTQLVQLFLGGVVALLIGGGVLFQNMVLYSVPLGAGNKGYATDAFLNARVDAETLASNVVRNTLIQIPLPGIAQRVEWFLKRALILDNPGNTWPGSVFHIPSVPIPQEDIAPSPLQVLLIVIGAVIVLQSGSRREKLIVTGGILAFLAFSLFLKWQPYNNRLDLTILLLCLPMTLSAIWKRFPRLLFALCSLSVMAGFAVITGNTSRPLVSYTPLAAIVKPYMPEGAKIPVSIFVLPRHDQYYVARAYWDGLYSQAAAAVGRDGVHTVHFLSIDGFTYPLMMELQKVDAVIVPDDFPAEGAVTTTGTIQSPAISVQ